MPLTEKGREIKRALVKEYGAKKGEQVLYAGKNKGTFTGIDAQRGKDALSKAISAGEREMEGQKQAKALLEGKRVSGLDRGRVRR